MSYCFGNLNSRAKHVEVQKATVPWSLEEVNKELAHRSLREFCGQAWKILEPATIFVPNWHIDAICEHLEAVSNGQIKQLIINVPPRCMKSLTVAVFWPAWEWVKTKGTTRWVFSSYSFKFATRDSVKCRQLIESQWYRRNWGDLFQLAGDQNEKTRYETTNKGFRMVHGIHGSGGATGEGGDVLVCDDPHGAIEMYYPETMMASVLDWWDTVMPTRLNDQRTGRKVIIQQRLHEKDLSGHLLRKNEGWELLRLPIRYETSNPCRTSIGWQDPRTDEKELLWPAKFPEIETAKLERALQPWRSSGQLQQRPSPQVGGIIKRHWFRFYTQIPDADNWDDSLQSWDLAFKALRDSSYVCGQAWCKVGADAYLLDLVRDHLSFTETCTAITNLSDKWPAIGAKLVEDAANGPAVMDHLKHKVPGLIAKKADGSKEARLTAVSPFFESGNVYVPHPDLCPWVLDFIEELCNFPRAEYKDQADACSQALRRLMIKANGHPGLLAPVVSLTRDQSWAMRGSTQ